MNAGDDYDIRKKLARVERDRDALAAQLLEAERRERQLLTFVHYHHGCDPRCQDEYKHFDGAT